jgi:hypothetical protein
MKRRSKIDKDYLNKIDRGRLFKITFNCGETVVLKIFYIYRSYAVWASRVIWCEENFELQIWRKQTTCITTQ